MEFYLAIKWMEMEIMVSEISQTEVNIARSLSYMESKPKKE
jgi:hypothetical protein